MFLKLINPNVVFNKFFNNQNIINKQYSNFKIVLSHVPSILIPPHITWQKKLKGSKPKPNCIIYFNMKLQIEKTNILCI